MSLYNNVLRVKNSKVTETLDSSLSLEGTIGQAIETLKLKEQEHSVDHDNLRLSLEYNYDGEGQHLVLLGDRPATKEEQEAWEVVLTERSKQTEEWERKQFEALQRKYGKESK